MFWYDDYFGRYDCELKNVWDYNETSEGIELSMDVPGYGKEDIKIDCNDGLLKIEGDNKKKTFSRKWNVDTKKLDIKNAKANVKNGQLNLKIPYIKNRGTFYQITVE